MQNVFHWRHKILLVFSVTPFKIDQNKNQNRSIDKTQNLGNVTLNLSSTVTIDFKLADIKLESSKAYLLKLEKNLPYGF